MNKVLVIFWLLGVVFSDPILAQSVNPVGEEPAEIEEYEKKIEQDKRTFAIFRRENDLSKNIKIGVGECEGDDGLIPLAAFEIYFEKSLDINGLGSGMDGGVRVGLLPSGVLKIELKKDLWRSDNHRHDVFVTVPFIGGLDIYSQIVDMEFDGDLSSNRNLIGGGYRYNLPLGEKVLFKVESALDLINTKTNLNEQYERLLLESEEEIDREQLRESWSINGSGFRLSLKATLQILRRFLFEVRMSQYLGQMSHTDGFSYSTYRNDEESLRTQEAELHGELVLKKRNGKRYTIWGDYLLRRTDVTIDYTEKTFKGGALGIGFRF
jgi:hypothetical protein